MVRQLSISFVTETYPPEVNGVAMTLSRFITGLGKRGHRLHLVRPMGRGEAAGNPVNGVDVLAVGGLRIPLYRDAWPCTSD